MSILPTHFWKEDGGTKHGIKPVIHIFNRKPQLHHLQFSILKGFCEILRLSSSLFCSQNYWVIFISTSQPSVKPISFLKPIQFRANSQQNNNINNACLWQSYSETATWDMLWNEMNGRDMSRTIQTHLHMLSYLSSPIIRIRAKNPLNKIFSRPYVHCACFIFGITLYPSGKGCIR